MSEEKPFINVLLLGEKDAGKSAFIDLFANYLKYKHYSYLSGNMKRVTVDKNNTYLRRTENITDYIFHVKNVKLRLIDTPGFSYCDKRSSSNLNNIGKNNEDNIKKIVHHIAKYRYINAIAIAIKSNLEVINDFIEFLLPHFDKSVCRNVIFTYETGLMSNSIRIEKVRQFLKDIPEEIPCSRLNTFRFNGWFFSRYLEDLKSAERVWSHFYKIQDWKQDSISCESLIEYILGEESGAGLKPHFIKPIEDDENPLALINYRLENVEGIIRESTRSENDPRFINQRIDNLCDDVKNIRELLQELSREIRDIKQGVQAETPQSNQGDNNEEQPKRFKKLFEDINNLKKFRVTQETEVEEQGEAAQPKFQKLMEELSDLKKLREKKNTSDNNEMMGEVKRITGQQESISKQLEDLKFFIVNTLSSKQEVHDGQETQNKPKK